MKLICSGLNVGNNEDDDDDKDNMGLKTISQDGRVAGVVLDTGDQVSLKPTMQCCFANISFD